MASNGDGYLVVWADKRNDRSTYDIYGARVSATGQVLDPEGIPICTAPDSQWYPAVASDGTNYLVVWSDSRHNGADGYSLELYGARISPGGAVLDSGAFKMTQGEVVFQPTVAFNGTEYLVAAYAWEHNGHRGTTLLGVRVTPTGVVRDSQELILHQSGAGSGYPAIVASLGEDWLVAWNLGGNGVAGARVSRNGVVSSPQMFVNRGETWIHGLAAAGNSYFLTSVASRQIGTDTHVMDVFGTRITPEGQPQSTVLIAANTNQTIGSHLQPTTYMQYQPTAAANGSDVFVVWEAGAIYTNGGNFRFLSDIRGARVNASGEVSPVVSICAAPQDQGYSALAFNGQQFLAVWQDARTAPPEDYTAYNHFDVYGARLTPGGAVIESDGFLISKLKSNRIICPPPIQWQHSFGGSDYDYLYSLEPTTDGGYILGGLSYSPTNGNKTSPHVGGSFNADVWLIRLNASGQKVWERAFGGNENENALSVKQTADGGFIVAGWSASGPSGNKTSPHLGWEDGWVIRLDAQGNKLWERTFGGGLWEFFFQVHELPDGGFILGGLSGSCPGCAVENG
ncbi:MAG TPA: hypothetical protein VJW76_04600, partial [Verrucomicrobiae bacterium]|nr:hypothetical protein [Verrucomicrobiae bacterium]